MQALNNAWRGLVRFGFRLLYNEMAFTYDTVSVVVSLGEWRCWQRAALAHLPLPAAGTVLELAHGTGNLQLDLHAQGYQCIGYDLSPYMGRIAQGKLRGQGVTVPLVRGMAQQLPFASGTFPAVVSTFPTDFILASTTLREVQRVLQPNGVFVIVPNGVLTGGGVVRNVLEWLYKITGQREGPAMFDVGGYFGAYGFEALLHETTCRRSVAQVVVARKDA